MLNKLTKFTTNLSILLIIIFIISSFSGCSENEQKKIRIGDNAPDFLTTTLDNKQISITKWEGSPIILRFWETDCKYCQADTPIFNRFYNEHKAQGLKVVYINIGEEYDTVVDFAKNLKIDFPVIHAKGTLIANKYNVKIAPQTIIISPDQKIITAILGGVSSEELNELVGHYLVP